MQPCPTGMSWNPIAGASAQSAFAAVLAGFVFIGIVQLLAEGKNAAQRGPTLKLFIASFVCLASSSYVDSIVAGEAVCMRAWSERMGAGGLVAIGALALFAAIAWLVPPHYLEDKSTRRFLIAASVFVALAITELVTIAGRTYLREVPAGQPWRQLLFWYMPIAIAAIGAAWASRYRARKKTEPDARDLESRRVTVAAGIVLASAVATLVDLGLLTDREPSLWISPAGWVVAVTIVVPLLADLVALPVLVWAMPTERHWRRLLSQQDSVE